MLVCFLKPPDNVNVECRIIKFIDRIWLDEDGNGEVMRLFIVQVSRGKLTGISCLIPHRSENISNLEDYSRFSTDRNYPFNTMGRQTGEINVINDDTVIFDDLRCRVSHDHGMDLRPYGQGTTLDIDLRNAPITRKSKELIRLRYNVANLVRFAPTASVFTFSYFCPERCRHGFSTLSRSHTIIPVVPVLNKLNFRGGFDVFIYPPHEFQVTSDSGKYSHRDIDCDSKGTPIARTNGGLWRLRIFVKNPTKGIDLKKGSSAFSGRLDIDGSIVKPASSGQIEALQKELGRNTKWSLIALIIAIVSAAVLYLPKLVFWIQSLVQQAPTKPPP